MVLPCLHQSAGYNSQGLICTNARKGAIRLSPEWINDPFRRVFPFQVRKSLDARSFRSSQVTLKRENADHPPIFGEYPEGACAVTVARTDCDEFLHSRG